MGSLNRVIRVAAGSGEVRAVVEDDFHHFRLRLRHDGSHITEVETQSLRAPWTLCSAAGDQLSVLVGRALVPRMAAVSQLADARHQCTHQFDLAALAISAAGRGIHARRYDIVVGDEVDGKKDAFLSRDGVLLLRWIVADYRIVDPTVFAGRHLGTGFTAWVADMLDPDVAEAALVLRRGVFISGGRGMAKRLDRMAQAPVLGGCWVQQPEQAARARRNVGSTLDFTRTAGLLTRTDDHWLESRERAEPDLLRKS